MPRPSSIQPEELVEKAMFVYWVKGYSGTSVNDLVEETSASKSMIYNLNGKKGVFIDSFFYYMENHSNPYLVALEKDDRGIEAFREAYAHLINALVERSLPKACMFVNTAVELGKQDSDINQLYQKYQKRVRDVYTLVMERSYKLGEFKNYSKIPYYVDLHLNLLFSLAALYKVRTKKALMDFVNAQLDLIQ